MKLKINLSQKLPENVPITCVVWSNTEEVYSISDNNQLLSWSVSNNLPTKIADLHKDLFGTDLQFLPKIGTTVGKHGELILLTSADGKFHLLNRSGRLERSIEGHKGAILVGSWSNDGSGFLTAGEDGLVKTWSKTGMLRSTVVSSDSSIYAACWAPESQSIAYTYGKCIVVKLLAPNTKPLRWRAHEGLVLCLAWSSASDLIVSGGEDCKYRVWDNLGRPLFSSSLHDHHITSVAWSPTGNLFAVGSFNTLRLCDSSGWSRSLEKPPTGSIYKMSWSSDGTQLAGACANGHVLFAHVVERHAHYLNFSASVSERKIVTVKNVLDDTFEVLEFPERVIQMAMRYSHLVVTTPNQCYVYNTNNWNTPHIFELKDGSVLHLELVEKHMLLIEKTTIGIYNYQGKLKATPRWPNIRVDSIKSPHITLGNDTLAVRDSNDQKYLTSNRNTSDVLATIQHTAPIIQVALDQQGEPSDRTLALLDKSRDLYIVKVRGLAKTFSKLGRKIDSFKWNATVNIISAIQDAQLIVWYCPEATFNSKLLHLCSYQYDSPELGRSPKISDFVGNSVAIRRADGSLINVTVSPFPELIHKSILENKWNDALNLCRSINDETVWACLAVLATQSNFDSVAEIAEEAFANINHYDKLLYIQYIKTLSSKAEQKAHIAMLGGKFEESESILLHNGMVFQAIYNHIQMHNWTRALDLAVKHKTHIDTVLYFRQKYLETLHKAENNNKYSSLQEKACAPTPGHQGYDTKFSSLKKWEFDHETLTENKVTIDPQKIEEKIVIELQKRKPSR